MIVEDYDEVTPELLRTAYVEALYHAKDFEYHRLTQSFWWSFITNVSVARNSEAIYAFFPPESEDPTFTRPAVPYNCGEGGRLCGAGTKRTPKSYC